MAEADFDEKAFDMIGPNTPRDVKDAWMEAAKDVNANGMGIKKNGMLSHISVSYTHLVFYSRLTDGMMWPACGEFLNNGCGTA